MQRVMHIGKDKGFSKYTNHSKDQTKFYPKVELPFWRPLVTKRLSNTNIHQFVLQPFHRPKNKTLDAAILRTSELFRLPNKVKMLHLKDLFNKESDMWSKSPGLPWFNLGYKTIRDICKDPDAVDRIRNFAYDVETGYCTKFPDCMAGVRTLISKKEKNENEIRTDWEYPAAVTFLEATFAIPLIKAYQDIPESNRPIAYGFEIVVGGMKHIYERFKGEGRFVGIDFKRFDKTVPLWLIFTAFDILRFNIDLKHYEKRGDADYRHIVTLFSALVKYFINTNIRTSEGNRYVKFSGIASGSYFTQLIGSITNTILLNWLSLEQFGVFPEDLLVLADESLMRSLKTWDLDFCNLLLHDIGMEINIINSQQRIDLNCFKFLGFQVNNGMPIKSHSEWMAELCYPEHQDKKYSDLQNRALGLYYASMCLDKKFAGICRTIITLNKFDIYFPPKLERMLKDLGIDPSELDSNDLPNSLYFTKYM